MSVVDSSAWLEYFASEPNARYFTEPIEETDQLLVPTIILFEVYKRILQQRSTREALQAFANMQKGLILDLDAATALHAAKISYEKKLPLADSVIYATALLNGATLWTQDSDFEGMEDVRYFPKTA